MLSRNNIRLLTALVLTVFCVVSITYAGSEQKIKIGHDTTRLTEPVREDGTIDYVAAINKINSEGVTPDNNAFISILKILGPVNIAIDNSKEFLDKLGIKKPTGNFLIIPNKINGITYEAREKLWTREQHPEMAKWLDSNSEPLSRLSTIVGKDKYYMPYLVDESKDKNSMAALMLFPYLSEIKELCSILATQANMLIAEQQYEKAWKEIKTIYHIGSIMHQKEESLLVCIVSFSIRNLALNSTKLMLTSGNLDRDLLKEIYDYMQELEPAKLSISAERYAILDYIINMHQYGFSQVEMFLSEITGGDYDEEKNLYADTIDNDVAKYVNWNQLLEEVNQHFDKLDNIIQSDESYRNKIRQTDTWDDKYSLSNSKEALEIYMPLLEGNPVKEVSPEKMPKILHQYIPSIIMPSISRSITLEYKTNTEQQVVTVAAALEYSKKEYTYPLDLDSLVLSGYLDKGQVTDPFTGQDLAYKRTATGYTLYSLGENMKDDQGQNSNSPYISELDDITASR